MLQKFSGLPTIYLWDLDFGNTALWNDNSQVNYKATQSKAPSLKSLGYFVTCSPCETKHKSCYSAPRSSAPNRSSSKY